MLLKKTASMAEESVVSTDQKGLTTSV